MKLFFAIITLFVGTITVNASKYPVFPSDGYEVVDDAIAINTNDTMPEKKSTKDVKSNGVVKAMVDYDEFVITIENDEVKKMKINGRYLTSDELKENKLHLDAIVNQIKKNGISSNYTYHFSTENGEFSSKYASSKAYASLAPVARMASLRALQAVADTKRATEEGIRATVAGRIAAEEGMKAAEAGKMAAEEGRKAAETSKSIINDLMEADIITSKKNLWFKLSNSELVVNGKKQSDATHKKFKEKYLKNTKGSISYNDSNESHIHVTD